MTEILLYTGLGLASVSVTATAIGFYSKKTGEGDE